MAGAKQTLGGRIRQLRKQRGFTQDQLAEAAGIDSKSLSRIECSVFNPAIETLENLATAMKVRMQDFFVQDYESPKALRIYLLELIATASDKQIVQLAEVVSRTVNKKVRSVRNQR
jgi:transcriptional regulator with XRE-family HTH domain